MDMIFIYWIIDTFKIMSENTATRVERRHFFDKVTD
jgi:hypothetical protein